MTGSASGGTFGSTLDGWKQLGSSVVQALGGLVVAHGVGHGVQVFEGDSALEEAGRLGSDLSFS